MDKEDVVIMYNDAMEYCSATKRDVICSNIDAPRESHTKSSQTEKDRERYHMVSPMCANEKTDTNKLI